MNDYNKEWCDERHEFIEKEFKKVWNRIKNSDARLWAIIVLQVVILGGLVGTLLK